MFVWESACGGVNAHGRGWWWKTRCSNDTMMRHNRHLTPPRTLSTLPTTPDPQTVVSIEQEYMIIVVYAHLAAVCESSWNHGAEIVAGKAHPNTQGNSSASHCPGPGRLGAWCSL